MPSGYLRIFDFLNNEQYKVKLKLTPENRQITQLKNYYGEPGCERVQTLQPVELLSWINNNKEFTLIDVRQKDEFNLGHLNIAHLIPIDRLESRINEIAVQKPIVAMCQKGGRSAQAAAIISENNSTAMVYTLDGGMEKWQTILGNKLLVS